ncbi:MAG: diaminopimelate epimerase [Ferruginibacter sp.]|nr:diaminopimelate epimerase [Bacteroidota bacterium]MBX2920041.1 diaminopimelate epimerase [Ferruginibacter sp.]MCB0708450.1 diaminopimelate epimerase [Chitinophagaceae bacterium]MCC7379312.1 diaminopimelate epimerase [Chitinophagaceae bacterium]
MKIEFYKYQGAGNDFVILENRDEKYSGLTNAQVKFICNRRFGVGADGLMLINKHNTLDFEMIYYNADGLPGSMCGNGGRCIVKFAKDQGMYKVTYRFMAVDGLHEADIDMHGMVRLKMQNVNEVKLYPGYAILNTGSPHYVKFASNVADINVVEAGREIRYSKQFKKEGINVNFAEPAEEDGIYVRTYERGVEDETLSCGTGVTASALMFAHNDKGFNRVEVKTAGGNLSVEYNKIDDEHFENILLCGPAIMVYKGEIEV